MIGNDICSYKACFLTGIALLLFTACVGEDTASEGDLAIEVAGGAALREGFPCDMHGAHFAFADGWEVEFDKYVRSVGEVRLQEQDSGEEIDSWVGSRVMDLAASSTSGEALTVIDGLPARRFDVSFNLAAPTELPEESNTSEEEIRLMIDRGWSVYFSGEARHPETSRSVRFELGFPVSARYYECNNGKDSTRGVAIEANKTTGVFIYPCVEHLFFDSLAAGDENLRFEAWAAAAGDDGVITEEDLKSQDLTDLRDAERKPLLNEEGERVVYKDGGLLPPDERTLYHFVRHAARDGAHFNGFGLCKVEAVTLRVMDKEVKLLAEVNRALAKFEQGDYGLCEGTEEPIGYRRLKVVPWARYGIEYKERRELDQMQRSVRLAGR